MDERCGRAQWFDLLQASPPDRSGFFFHHIIIIMDIDDDMMDAILNNQQKSGRPWNARVRRPECC
jgi:hypothetical protein